MVFLAPAEIYETLPDSLKIYSGIPVLMDSLVKAVSSAEDTTEKKNISPEMETPDDNIPPLEKSCSCVTGRADSGKKRNCHLNEVVESSPFGTAFLSKISCFFNRAGYRTGFFPASAFNTVGIDFDYSDF